MTKILPKLLVIQGPTASGKTALSILLAEKFDGEIINADSRQFYRGMDIGTAKITEDEKKEIPHHLFDILNPDEEYNVALYKNDCVDIIEDIHKRGKLPILVGGTGLYISAIIENYSFGEGEPTTGPELFDYLLIEPDISREELYEKINARQYVLMDRGHEEEVRELSKNYNWDIPAMTGIGYRQFKDYFEGDIDKDELIEQLQQATRNYAKRQITWFKRYEDIVYRVKGIEEASKIVEKWLFDKS